MTDSFSTSSLRNVVSFPFKTKGWESRFIIGTALLFAGMVIPVIPQVFFLGYLLGVMRQTAHGEEPSLPEWKDWGRLGIDGLKTLAAAMVYLLPGLLIVIGGYLIYFAFSIFGNLAIASNSRGGSIGIGGWLIFVGLGVFIVLLIVGFFISLLGIAPFPAALAHLAARDRFRAVFQVGEWWAVVRADMPGFFIAWVITLGLNALNSVILMAFYHSLVLCCVGYLFLMPLSFYLLLISSTLFGQAYYTGSLKLNLGNAQAPRPN